MMKTTYKQADMNPIPLILRLDFKIHVDPINFMILNIQ